MSDKYKDAADAFADPELFGSAALIMAYDLLGDFLEWEPETIEADLRMRGVNPSKGLMDRLLAAAAVRNSDVFHRSLEGFLDICHALNFGRVAANAMSEADLDDVAWGCVEARVIEGTAEFDEQGFSNDIKLYSGFLLDRAGFDRKPLIMKFAELRAGRGSDLPVDSNMLEAFDSNVAEMVEQLDQGASERLRVLFGQIKRLPLKTGRAP